MRLGPIEVVVRRYRPTRQSVAQLERDLRERRERQLAEVEWERFWHVFERNDPVKRAQREAEERERREIAMFETL